LFEKADAAPPFVANGANWFGYFKVELALFSCKEKFLVPKADGLES